MERKTLLSRGVGAPTAQPVSVNVPSGAFGDYSGVQDLGSAISHAGAVADQMSQRLDRMQKEKDARDHAEARDLIAATAMELSAKAHQATISQSAETDGTETVRIATENFRDHQNQFQQSLSEASKKNPWVAKLGGDYARRVWDSYSIGAITQAHTTEAAAKVDYRQQVHDTANLGAINTIFGSDPEAALEFAKQDTERVFNDAKSFSRDYRFTYKSRMSAKLVDVFQGLALEQAKAGQFQPSLLAAMDGAEASGMISKEQKNRILALKIQGEKVSSADRDQKYNDTLAKVSEGANIDDFTVTAVVAGSVDPTKDQENIRAARIREMNAAAAIGVINGRVTKGELPFPHSEIYAQQKILRDDPNDTRVRGLMEQLGNAAGLKQLTGDQYTSDEVAKFRSAALSKVNDTIQKIDTGRANEVFQFSPLVTDAIRRTEGGDIKTQINETIKAYQASYEAAGIPAEKQVLMHQPHVDHLKSIFGQGDQNAFISYGQALAESYGPLAPVALNRALSNDPESAQFAPLVRMMTQGAQTNSAVAKKSIAIAVSSATRALFDKNYSELLKANPDDADLVKKSLEKISISTALMGTYDNLSTSDKIASALDMSSQPAGDQTINGILNTLQAEEGAASKVAMRDFLIKWTISDAFRQGGDRNVMNSLVKVSRSLNSAFMVVRTGGTDSPEPITTLEVPTSKHRDVFTNMLAGPAGGEAKSTNEEAQQTSRALDAVMLDGLDRAQYSGFLKYFAKMDDFLGTTALGWVGYHPNGFENRSFAMFKPLDKRPEAQLPDALRIPWADTVLPDGRTPGQVTKFTDSSNAAAVAASVKANVGEPDSSDPASTNHQVLSKNGYFRRLPNGDYQLYLRGVSVRAENNLAGVADGAVPVLKKLKDGSTAPIVISRRALMAFRDMQLDLRAPTSEAGLRP